MAIKGDWAFFSCHFPWVLVWTGGRLLLERRGRVYISFTIITGHAHRAKPAGARAHPKSNSGGVMMMNYT